MVIAVERVISGRKEVGEMDEVYLKIIVSSGGRCLALFRRARFQPYSTIFYRGEHLE